MVFVEVRINMTDERRFEIQVYRNLKGIEFEKRMGVLADFVQVMESSKSLGELVCTSSIYFGCRGEC